MKGSDATQHMTVQAGSAYDVLKPATGTQNQQEWHVSVSQTSP